MPHSQTQESTQYFLIFDSVPTVSSTSETTCESRRRRKEEEGGVSKREDSRGRTLSAQVSVKGVHPQQGGASTGASTGAPSAPPREEEWRHRARWSGGFLL
jgi:hypothetical protein